jgi:hypothetical protein
MKKSSLLISCASFFIPLFFLATLTLAQEQPAPPPKQIITLKDGSVIKGQLIGVNSENGAYILQTETLGQITVAAEKVLGINSADAPPVAKTNDQTQPNLDNIQNRPEFKSMKDTLLSDPAMFSKMQDLAADPEMMQILTDKDFLNSLATMDPAAIENNPKFQKLIHHPAMQALIESMKQKMPAGGLVPSQR